MQYFNVNNTVHVLDDGINPSDFIKQPFISITKGQADAMLAPPPLTAEQQLLAIQGQIDTLEKGSILNRMMREWSVAELEKAAISYGAAQIPALTAAQSLAYAYSTNIAYKKVKDLDVQITALRTQMDAIL